MNERPIDIKSDATSTKVRVSSTGEFARMISSFRGRHLVADAPAYAGGPGEAATPPELLLSAVGACALGMFDLICQRDNIPLKGCAVDIESYLDSSSRSEGEVSVFDKITIEFVFKNITSEEAQELIKIYQSSCPIYGSVKIASGEVLIKFSIQ